MRAYLSRLSVRPGGVVDVHGSGIRGGRALVRELLHSDPHPDGPGVVVKDCAWGAGAVEAPEVAASLGSYAVGDALPPGGEVTVSLWVWLTDLSQDAVLASWATATGTVTLGVQASRLAVEHEGGPHVLDHRIRERTWTFVAVTATGPTPTAAGALAASAWGRTGGPLLSEPFAADLRPVDRTLWIGARPGGPGELDGRVAGIRVHHAARDVVDLMNLMNGVGDPADAEWDLGDRSDPDLAPSVVPGTGPLALVHAPMRSAAVPPALEGSGRALCRAGSVHLHRDDTEDVGWPVVLRIDVPPDVEPGIFGVLLRSGTETYELPFVVSGADEVTLLVPTLTWQAYANLGRDASWPGLSHYSLHADGSAVTVTTSRRPSQTFAPSARLEVDAGDGFATGTNATHLTMADLYAWYWLRQEFPGRCGVIDDRDLHAGGPSVLDRTEVLVLSAHPEYWTAAMLDALGSHLERGRSVVYLGGNGLYWVTSLHPSKPHLMEIRRWGGSQTWSIDEADREHQFEARVGGLWEDAGRPPNATVGVGFGGFGNGPSMTFERTPESHDARWSWLFEGVDSETFGGAGLNSGAGNEFDLYDVTRPPPGESVVLATARPTSGDHFGTFERRGVRAPSDEVRSDLVLTLTPGGGLVLAVKPITASGALTSRRDRGLAVVVRNAIGRMLDTARPRPGSSTEGGSRRADPS